MIEPADRRRLEALLKWARERDRRDASLTADERAEFARRLEEFRGHPLAAIAKLADLQVHLTEDLSSRTFANLLVPIERALGKSVRDDDFLITSADRATTATAASPRIPVRLVLEHLRSSFNVGSILRSAEGLGVEHVYLTGYTPTPDNEKTARSALGAQELVPWEKVDDLAILLARLRTEGHRIIALETARTATKLHAPLAQGPTVFVVGNERFGLEPAQLALCDEVRELPLSGQKNSLNVAVIAALAVYEWRRQWPTS